MSFPQKAEGRGHSNVLKEEGNRRVSPLQRKRFEEVSNNGLVRRLGENHDILDKLDTDFLCFEAGKTYRVIMMPAHESEAAE
jgi:hypothetical protein